MPMKDREEVPSAKVASLHPLLNDSVSHKASLFYGTGIKPTSGATPRKALQRFVQKIKEEEAYSKAKRFPGSRKDVEEVAEMDMSGSSSESFISQLDVGRFSRLSRARTPGSPILEEIREDEEA